MEDTNQSEKKIVITIAIILILIVSLSVGYMIVYADIFNIYSNDNESNSETSIQIQTQLIYVTPEKANEIIETNSNLKILDVRSCKCKWNGDRLTETTEWTEYLQPEKFNNTEYDLLVYCQNGNDSSSNESNYFSSNLIGKTQGMIYTLDGGIIRWKNEGYPIYIPYN